MSVDYELEPSCSNCGTLYEASNAMWTFENGEWCCCKPCAIAHAFVLCGVEQR